jgi:hypothetical protein
MGLPLVDIRAAALLPEDISGIPLPNKARDSVAFAPPAWCIAHAPHRFVLFLDELNQASPPVQKALYQVVLDKVWANVHMPEMRVIAAGNPQSMWSELDPLSPALVGPDGRFTPVPLEANGLWPTTYRWLTHQYPEEMRRLQFDAGIAPRVSPRSIEKGIMLFRAGMRNWHIMSQLLTPAWEKLLADADESRVAALSAAEMGHMAKLIGKISRLHNTSPAPDSTTSYADRFNWDLFRPVLKEILFRLGIPEPTESWLRKAPPAEQKKVATIFGEAYEMSLNQDKRP